MSLASQYGGLLSSEYSRPGSDTQTAYKQKRAHVERHNSTSRALRDTPEECTPERFFSHVPNNTSTRGMK